MKQKVMIVISALAIVLCASIAIYINMNLSTTMDTLEFIAGRYRGGTFIDHDHSIEVDGPEDIGYWNKGTTWYVKFGKLELEFTKKDLQDPEMKEAIAAVGLDVKGNLENNDLRWFWGDEELERWVPN